MESGNTMALFFLSFFGACLVYAFVMAFLIGVTRKAIPPNLGKWISIACSVIIGILGIGVAIQVLAIVSDWLNAMEHGSNRKSELVLDRNESP